MLLRNQLDKFYFPVEKQRTQFGGKNVFGYKISKCFQFQERLSNHYHAFTLTGKAHLEVNKGFLPLVILILPGQPLQLSPQRWQIQQLTAAAATLTSAVESQLGLALGLAERVDCAHAIQPAVTLRHLMEDYHVADGVNLAHLHAAVGHILVRVAVPVLGVGVRRHLHLLPVLCHAVPVHLAILIIIIIVYIACTVLCPY